MLKQQYGLCAHTAVCNVNGANRYQILTGNASALATIRGTRSKDLSNSRLSFTPPLSPSHIAHLLNFYPILAPHKLQNHVFLRSKVVL